MMAGEVAATLLSRAAVPVLYFLLKRREAARVPAEAPQLHLKRSPA
jgi:hypothetical protein